MVNYPNGSVPASALAPLDGQPGCFLRADAAHAWNLGRAEVRRRTGIVLSVRGWNRSLAEQELFFFQRYEQRAGNGPYGDVRWYKGKRYVRVRGAAAAIPGTSNHGWGLAVDVADYGNVGEFGNARRVATFPILAQYGWTDTEGRGVIREPWHLVFNPALFVSNPIGGGGSVNIPNIPGAPAPIEEDELSAADVEKILGYINTVAQEARANQAANAALASKTLTEVLNTKAGVWTGGAATIDGVAQKFNYGVLPIAAHNQRLIAAQTAALSELTKQLAANAGGGVAVDYARIEKAIADAVAKGVDVNVTVEGGK